MFSITDFPYTTQVTTNGKQATRVYNFFISDLHLDAQTTELNQRFLAFCQQLLNLAQQAKTEENASVDIRENSSAISSEIANLKRHLRLYILGDFLALGIGDFVPDWFALMQEALQQLAAAGVELFFMVGNRDFLLGKKFASAIGATFLPENTLVDLDVNAQGQAIATYRETPDYLSSITTYDGRYTNSQHLQKILEARLKAVQDIGVAFNLDPKLEKSAASLRLWLCHGDNLCLADENYLRYRKFIRSKPIQLLEKIIPTFVVKKIAKFISGRSQEKRLLQAAQDLEQEQRDNFICHADLELRYVQYLAQVTQAQVLVHGHVHKQRLIKWQAVQPTAVSEILSQRQNLSSRLSLGQNEELSQITNQEQNQAALDLSISEHSIAVVAPQNKQDTTKAINTSALSPEFADRDALAANVRLAIAYQLQEPALTLGTLSSLPLTHLAPSLQQAFQTTAAYEQWLISQDLQEMASHEQRLYTLLAQLTNWPLDRMRTFTQNVHLSEQTLLTLKEDEKAKTLTEKNLSELGSWQLLDAQVTKLQKVQAYPLQRHLDISPEFYDLTMADWQTTADLQKQQKQQLHSLVHHHLALQEEQVHSLLEQARHLVTEPKLQSPQYQEEIANLQAKASAKVDAEFAELAALLAHEQRETSIALVVQEITPDSKQHFSLGFIDNEYL